MGFSTRSVVQQSRVRPRVRRAATASICVSPGALFVFVLRTQRPWVAAFARARGPEPPRAPRSGERGYPIRAPWASMNKAPGDTQIDAKAALRTRGRGAHGAGI